MLIKLFFVSIRPMFLQLPLLLRLISVHLFLLLTKKKKGGGGRKGEIAHLHGAYYMPGTILTSL